MFVNGLPAIISESRHIRFGTIEMILDQKAATFEAVNHIIINTKLVVLKEPESLAMANAKH